MERLPEPGQPFVPYRLFVGLFVPSSIARHPGLSSTAKLAYGRLCQYAGADGLAEPEMATLAREIGVGQRRAREAVAELESLKLIRRIIIPGKRSQYLFIWQPWLADSLRPPTPEEKFRGKGSTSEQKRRGPRNQSSGLPGTKVPGSHVHESLKENHEGDYTLLARHGREKPNGNRPVCTVCHTVHEVLNLRCPGGEESPFIMWLWEEKCLIGKENADGFEPTERM